MFVVCRFFVVSAFCIENQDNNQITIEGNTAWAISEAPDPAEVSGECDQGD